LWTIAYALAPIDNCLLSVPLQDISTRPNLNLKRKEKKFVVRIICRGKFCVVLCRIPIGVNHFFLLWGAKMKMIRRTRRDATEKKFDTKTQSPEQCRVYNLAIFGEPDWCTD